MKTKYKLSIYPTWTTKTKLVFTEHFRNERLYRLFPGVFRFWMGINKLDRKGYPLS